MKVTKREMQHSIDEGSISNDDESSDSSEDSVEIKRADDWTNSELCTLVDMLEKYVPLNDIKKYELSLKKIEWEKVQVGNHSWQNAKNKFEEILNCIRKFRTLSEILVDVRQWVVDPTLCKMPGKKPRHPEKPKRPLTSYMVYYTENKDKVAADTNLDLTKVSKIMGERFNALSAKKKQKYIKKAELAKEKYLQDLEAFYEKYPEERELSKQKRRVQKKPGPVPPRNAFAFYYQTEGDKVDVIASKMAFREICQQNWKKLSHKKKGKYIKKALEDEERYLRDLEEYKKNNPNFTPVAIRSNISKEERHILSKLAGKPEKPPNSGYSLFSREMLNDEDLKKRYSVRNRMTQISKMWKALKDSKKKVYDQRAADLLEQYKLEFANYLETLPEEKKKEELERSVTRPKVASSAFNMYAKEVMPSYKEKYSGSSVRKLRRQLMKEFESLPATTKSAYQAQVEMKSRTRSKNRPTLYKNEPEPPPNSAYGFFMKRFLSENSHLNPKVRMMEGPKIWQALAEADKAKYSLKLEKARREYFEKYTQFVKNLSPEDLEEYSTFKAKHSQQTKSFTHMEVDSEDSNEESDINSDSDMETD